MLVAVAEDDLAEGSGAPGAHVEGGRAMTVTTLAREAREAEEHPLLIVERFLREREAVWRQIKHEYHINDLLRQMLTSSAAALGGYGLVMGASQGNVAQIVASAIKLPILFLLTLAICLPTLYLFNLLLGGRLSARQVLALVLSGITVTSNLTLAFAPITLFFLVTAWSYVFFILLNVVILGFTGLIGLAFVVGGMRSMNELAREELGDAAEEGAGGQARSERQVSMGLLLLWIMIFGFVGTQLGWALRPFYGHPSESFQLFRTIEGNFYTTIGTLLLELLR
jgi:hypothetical protein